MSKNAIRAIILYLLLIFEQSILYAKVLPVDLGGLGLKIGMLEVARDQNFQNILSTQKLGTARYNQVNFPETGIYYIRVLDGQQIVWREAMFVLLEEPKPGQYPKLSWNTKQAYNRYRLYMNRGRPPHIWVDTTDSVVYLDSIGSPWLIRCLVQTDSGQQKPIQEMNWAWTQKADDLVKPSKISIGTIADDIDQSQYEPEDADLLQGSESATITWAPQLGMTSLEPLKRKHRLFGWIRYLKEEFQIDKKDRFAALPSQGIGTGLAAQYFLQGNMSITAHLDTHATQTEYELGGSLPPANVQKRMRSHLAFGLDLLNTTSREVNWSLNVGPVISLLQLPLERDSQKVTDFGLKLALEMFKPSINMEYLFLKSGSRELLLQTILPWKVFLFKPFAGIYRYNSRQSSGTVTAIFKESGLRLGVEADF